MKINSGELQEDSVISILEITADNGNNFFLVGHRMGVQEE